MQSNAAYTLSHAGFADLAVTWLLRRSPTGVLAEGQRLLEHADAPVTMLLIQQVASIVHSDMQRQESAALQ